MTDSEQETTEKRPWAVGSINRIEWARTPEEAYRQAFDVENKDYGDIERFNETQVLALATDDGELVGREAEFGRMLKAESQYRRPYENQIYCPECGRGLHEGCSNTNCPRCEADLEREGVEADA